MDMTAIQTVARLGSCDPIPLPECLRDHFPRPAGWMRRAPEEEAIFRLDRPAGFPDNWQKGQFFLEGHVPINFYVAHADKAWGVVAASSGIKSPYAMGAETIDAFLKNGLSVIWAELPNPGHKPLSMTCLQATIDHFFLHPDSPVHQIFNSDMVKFAQGHSTGGQLLMGALNDPDKRARLYDLYRFFILDAPFFDTANASVENIRAAKSLKDKFIAKASHYTFSLYADWCRNCAPQKTFWGRIFLNYGMELYNRKQGHMGAPCLVTLPREAVTALRIAVQTVKELIRHVDFLLPKDHAMADRGITYMEPFYGQILQLQAAGRKVVASAQPFDEHAQSRILMIAGAHDPFSCPKTTAYLAQKIGADFIRADAAHNTLDQDNSVRAHVLSMCEEHKPILVEPEIDAPPALPQSAEREPFLPRILRGFGVPFERGARALNSATGLFQNLFRRRVGNPEMGGETEGRAVDTGHALRL